MRFTNVTDRSIYLQCCHRTVDPGGSFSYPWLSARGSRGLVMAMRSQAFAWASEDGEPEVPGSPALPDPAIARREAEAAEKAAVADAARLRARQEEDEAAMKANMARMGRFDVPTVTDCSKVKAVVRERPVTADDVIAGDRPKSLADIRRHNKAVKTFKRGEAQD